MKLKVLLLFLGLAMGLALGNVFFSPPESSKLYSVVMPRKVWTALDRYAPKHYSRGNEELIIRHFFADRRGGFFLDVGAYDYKIENNTYYLEKNLSWHGIAIDANRDFERGYINNRPNTKFYSFFVSDKSDEEADFYLVKDPKHLTKSTAVKSFIAGREATEIKVATITLNDLLQKTGVNKVDFLSLDIELWEPHALAGFDIKKYKPALVCVEAHTPVQKQLLQYFAENDYVRLEQYLLLDQNNWYFGPKDLLEK
jgi:FkbM family methyltransferase